MLRLLTSAILISLSTYVASANDFVTNQNADLILGLSSFTDFGSNTVNASTSDGPDGVAIDPATGKVFVSEVFSNRILRYASSASLINGEPAEAVIGQVNFSGGAANQGLANPGPNTLANPAGLFIDSTGALWVADTANNRILTFFGASTLLPITNAYADLVLGQSNFTTKTPGSAANKFNNPFGVFISAADTLYVCDYGNNRVLGYKLISQNNFVNPNASFVVGQTALTNVTAGFGANQLNDPAAAYVDSGDHLWVADRNNSRVLRFDHASSLPTTNAFANGALGRPDTTSQGISLTAAGLHFPQALAMDADGSLYVSDNYDNRVLIYKNADTLATGSAADIVLGHPDFTSNFAGPDINTLPGSAQMAFDPQGRLFVANTGGDRIVRFTKPSSSTHRAPTVTISGRKKITTTHGTFTIKGTATSTDGAVASVLIKQGHKSKAAKGTTHWSYKAKLTPGKNVFTVQASGSNGLASSAVKVTVVRN